MSLFALAAFCALPLAAGTAVVATLHQDGRAEKTLAGVLIALGLVLVPIHALAWLGMVSRGTVLASLLVGSVSMLGFAARRTGWPALRSEWLALLRLPWDTLRLAWRERHVAGIGLLAFMAIAAYTLWLAYLAPSTTWDGLWYHEAIVGYTLELGGVARAAVESRHQYVNGYPAMAEYAQLFVVVAGGRDLIDAVPTLMGAVLLLASYVLLRRFAGDCMQALGFALAVVLLPAVVLQFRSTLIDVTVAAFAATCMALLTRPLLRWVDVVLAALAIGLLAGSKASGALMGALYACLLAARLLGTSLRERRMRRGLAQLMAAVALMTLLGAPRYVQNFVKHENPIWPLDVRRAGLKLKGKRNSAPPNISARALLDDLLSPPEPEEEGHDTRSNGYGNALPYTGLPLAAAAVLVLAWRLLRALRRRQAVATEEGMLFALVVASGLGLWLVPALWRARLHLHAVLVLFALNAWLLRDVRSRRLADALIGAVLLSELVTLSWSRPGWGVSRAQAIELATLTVSERRLRDLGARTRFPEAVARALEQEVGPGELVAYDGPYLFLANLWNAGYSNRVRYAKCSNEGFAQSLELIGAKWVISARVKCQNQLDGSAAWERVGRIDGDTFAFRRRTPEGAATDAAVPSSTAEAPHQPATPESPEARDPSRGDGEVAAALGASSATRPDCRSSPPAVPYVTPQVSEVEAQAAAATRRLKGDEARLTAGPIVGAVSAQAATVWIKSDRPALWEVALPLTDQGQPVRRFAGPKLTAASDFTGAVTLTDLQPDTSYTVQVTLRGLASGASSARVESEASFRTQPAPGTPGKLRVAFGADISRVSDQPIFAQLASIEPDALLLIGDQVYADQLAPSFQAYADKYVAAWRIKQLRALMQRVPTYMIWDDHEIGDNYFAGKSARYDPARLAYELYVQSHNPAPMRAGKLYYTLQLRDVGFFVLDTRSERSDSRAEESPSKTMLGAAQKADLLHWLACNSSAIKVIVSSVAMSDRVNGRDSWNAFPTEREEIIGFIERERVDDVLVFSGDQHWSAVFVHERPHVRLYEFLATPLSKGRARAPTEPAEDVVARDNDNFVFGVVDFDTGTRPATVAFTLCAGGKPCRPGAEPAPSTGLNVRGDAENVPFTLRLSTSDFGLR